MNRKELQKKVREILADKLNIPAKDIGAEALLREELHIDSFSTIEIVYALEEEFNIKIPDEKVITAKRVKDIEELLWNALVNK